MNLKQTIDVNSENILNILQTYKTRLNLNYINIDSLSIEITRSLKKVMMLEEVYDYIANHCASKLSHHPEFQTLISGICIDMLHCNTDDKYINVVERLYNNFDSTGSKQPLLDSVLYNIVKENHLEIEKHIDYSRDYLFDYFGIKTLERSYLMKLRYMMKDGKIVKSNKVIERPQHLFMRVAIGIHGYDLTKAYHTYDLLSLRYISHATPTLFNAGTPLPQMSSCYLLHVDDNIESIFESITDIAKISKWAGGIGITLSDIRGRGSIIRKTNGLSDGIIPLCQMLNAEGKYINQGGKRNGSIAVYLEPWHPDIFDFCELRTNTGGEDNKARDLFLALWIPDLFMKRVKEGKKWSLMCPNECPRLTDTYGDEFELLYLEYENKGMYKKQVNAVELFYHIMTCQIETGMPFMLYKDHCNRKSNQKNLGTIKSSNLCTEIIEYTDKDNTSVCNLASICLPRFIENNIFNFEKLFSTMETLVDNLDIVIDKNYYPTEKTRRTNLTHRPIGIGVMGLADTYNLLEMPFDSEEARILNKKIFETMYYAGLKKSNMLAKEKGTYMSYNGSPFSQGILQFDMWNLKEEDLLMNFDWTTLRENIKSNGMRHSLITTCMPTASTAQIMGNSECIEPYLTNVFTRSTLAGEFVVINNNLVNSLIKENLWNESIRKKIIVTNGALANIVEIPEKIRNIYKTAFEIKMKEIISQSCDRGPFIDQSQSLNLFMEKSNFDILASAHFYGWSNGIKTGMYYLRSRPSVDPIQFGIDIDDIKNINSELENNKKNKATSGMCLRRKGVKIADCSSCT